MGTVPRNNAGDLNKQIGVEEDGDRVQGLPMRVSRFAGRDTVTGRNCVRPALRLNHGYNIPEKVKDIADAFVKVCGTWILFPFGIATYRNWPKTQP